MTLFIVVGALVLVGLVVLGLYSFVKNYFGNNWPDDKQTD